MNLAQNPFQTAAFYQQLLQNDNLCVPAKALFSLIKFDNLNRLAKPASESSGNPYHYLLVQVDGEEIKIEVVGIDWGRDFQPYRSNKTNLSGK